MWWLLGSVLRFLELLQRPVLNFFWLYNLTSIKCGLNGSWKGFWGFYKGIDKGNYKLGNQSNVYILSWYIFYEFKEIICQSSPSHFLWISIVNKHSVNILESLDGKKKLFYGSNFVILIYIGKIGRNLKSIANLVWWSIGK